MAIKVIAQRCEVKRGLNPSIECKKKSPTILLIELISGERGIRTPGTSRYGSFQDYCNRPLYHLSSALLS